VEEEGELTERKGGPNRPTKQTSTKDTFPRALSRAAYGGVDKEAGQNENMLAEKKKGGGRKGRRRRKAGDRVCWVGGGGFFTVRGPESVEKGGGGKAKEKSDIPAFV